MIHFAPNLSKHLNISHGFFECSSVEMPSLNCAFIEAEPRPQVEKQRAFMIEKMAGKTLPLKTLKQIHSPTVHIVESVDQILNEGDGLVTQIPNVAIGILTADCGPLLFADPENKVIGAAHVGWRGAMSGVIESTISQMEKLGANRQNIIAALGPTIAQSSYEVGPEFEDFLGPYCTQFLKPAEKEDHFYFDLPGYIMFQLTHSKIKNFEDLKLNTYSGNFFSRRKTLHKSQHSQTKGFCNLSAIAIF